MAKPPLAQIHVSSRNDKKQLLWQGGRKRGDFAVVQVLFELSMLLSLARPRGEKKKMMGKEEQKDALTRLYQAKKKKKKKKIKEEKKKRK